MQNKNIETKGRILCCGDIHGAHRALEQVLERSNFDPKEDQLICLGDYVDGWSEAVQVVQHLLLIEKASIHPPIFIRGNHDEWCSTWLYTGVANVNWPGQGGRATMDSYLALSDRGPHNKFFRRLHNYYIDDQDRGFVHGGYVSRKGLGHEAHESSYYWDRDLWQLALMQHGRYHMEESDMVTDDSGKVFIEGPSQSRRFLKHKEIFIGHTATNMWNCKPHYPEYNDPNQEKKNGPIMVPMNRCNVWNLDTGAGWGGKLTIMDVDTKEYWQSDLVADLYPNEKGRR